MTFTLAGGCFWCLDAVFRRLKGVQSSTCGFAGGTITNPDYYDVASGNTGHAEVVQVTFDETVLPPDVLLDLFFTIHNPTTLNRQGADIGTQYRSAMFYVSDEQKALFEAAAGRAASVWGKSPIVTEITQLDRFYPAPDEHQDYFNKNPGNGYCSLVIEPKIIKARQKFASYWATS
jgi:peptide-methionine (S)-S-oxide reductase